jgi:hypothetical protein
MLILPHEITKLHPNLYWYISKSAFDFKFDSIKSTIDQPITPLAFYKKLSPIVAAVRQGHTYLYPASTQMTKGNESTEEKGTGPFSQFDFDYFDNKYMS